VKHGRSKKCRSHCIDTQTLYNVYKYKFMEMQIVQHPIHWSSILKSLLCDHVLFITEKVTWCVFIFFGMNTCTVSSWEPCTNTVVMERVSVYKSAFSCWDRKTTKAVSFYFVMSNTKCYLNHIRSVTLCVIKFLFCILSSRISNFLAMTTTWQASTYRRRNLSRLYFIPVIQGLSQ